MARQITKRRGKSPIKTRLEQERKAGRRDPEGKKAFQKGLAIASLAIPGSAAVKAGAKAVKAGKTVTRPSVLPKGKANIPTSLSKEVVRKNRRDAILNERKRDFISKRKEKPKAPKDTRSAKEKLMQEATDKFWAIRGYTKEGKIKDATRLTKEREALLKRADKMKKGGIVKKVKSHRGDGIAKRGRTRGRIV